MEWSTTRLLKLSAQFIFLVLQLFPIISDGYLQPKPAAAIVTKGHSSGGSSTTGNGGSGGSGSSSTGGRTSSSSSNTLTRSSRRLQFQVALDDTPCVREIKSDIGSLSNTRFCAIRAAGFHDIVSIVSLRMKVFYPMLGNDWKFQAMLLDKVKKRFDRGTVCLVAFADLPSSSGSTKANDCTNSFLGSRSATRDSIGQFSCTLRSSSSSSSSSSSTSISSDHGQIVNNHDMDGSALGDSKSNTGGRSSRRSSCSEGDYNSSSSSPDGEDRKQHIVAASISVGSTGGHNSGSSRRLSYSGGYMAPTPTSIRGGSTRRGYSGVKATALNMLRQYIPQTAIPPSEGCSGISDCHHTVTNKENTDLVQSSTAASTVTRNTTTTTTTTAAATAAASGAAAASDDDDASSAAMATPQIETSADRAPVTVPHIAAAALLNAQLGNLVGSIEFNHFDFQGTAMEKVGSLRKLYLADLAVRCDARRLGIATGLLKSVEQLATQDDYEEIYLHVEVHNVGAKKLYLNNGYSVLPYTAELKNFTEGHLLRPAHSYIMLHKKLPTKMA